MPAGDVVSAVLRGAAVGLGLGLAWGVVARGFMRLLSNAPEFSWSGTLAILALAAVAGAGVGVVHAARTAGGSGWWRLAALPGLLLFAGPGLVLLPGAVGMAFVLRGGPLWRVAGAALAAATPLAVAAGEGFVTGTQVVGLALMLLATVPLGWAVAEVSSRWRPHGATATRPTRPGVPVPAQ